MPLSIPIKSKDDPENTLTNLLQREPIEKIHYANIISASMQDVNFLALLTSLHMNLNFTPTSQIGLRISPDHNIQDDDTNENNPIPSFPTRTAESRSTSLVIMSAEEACTECLLAYAHTLVCGQELDRIVVDESKLTITASDYRPCMSQLGWYVRQIRTHTVWLTATLLPVIGTLTRELELEVYNSHLPPDCHNRVSLARGFSLVLFWVPVFRHIKLCMLCNVSHQFDSHHHEDKSKSSIYKMPNVHPCVKRRTP